MIARLFRYAAWLASGLAVLGFVLMATRGLTQPQPFDATERSLLELALRLQAHGPLYVAPDGAAAPAILPGYPVVAAVLIGTLGPDLIWLRMASLLTVVALAGLAMAVVREETKHPTLAVGSASLLLAGYALLTGQPAAARPEPLMLLLALSGGLALRSLPGSAGGLIAALLFSAACFTQAQALWFVAAALLYLTREDRGRLVPFTLGVAVFFGGGFVLLSQRLGPWFNYYAWDLPLHSLRFDGAKLVHMLGGQVLGSLGVMTVMSVLSFALPTRPWRGAGGLWPCIGLAAVAAALLASQSVTPDPQSGAICVAALALVGPISTQRVTQHLSTWPDSTRVAGEAVILLTLVLQFVALFASAPAGLVFAGA
jgi:hypothetical protein